ncbi:ABC-type phosphate transport system substrate-binding protein [Nocardioides ginsengisegetis]|uniref:ABC-type phosphate transport system substrate-binding protein n=1 Tax=Nocardioides ginsengisegetis TaxID=661491 RepID=A0A7W3PAN7_9ACTN|nr:Ig-like domain repeat protein [Nocardioides ginsengisegetis]MBA8804657.1 ABC-type phosphate transport system substrate-binding protein [Nocardioides ginsengisegetis]
MFVRKSLACLVAAALTGSVVALTAVPALAATDADDPMFTPVAADLIGVGSDTSQHALTLLADGWNAQTPAPAFKVASFAATSGGTITLPGGAINRPNGSGAGKALLYGSGNNADVDFARSSSAVSATEAQAGLQAFPFALDTLVMAVSNSVPSNAPTSLTPAQIVSIYKGDITNWSQIDSSKSGVIAPKIPQAGSGTRSFFVAQLKAMNGGVDVTLASSVAEVQEHDDTLIKNDPNAIAPFSKGRAGLLGTTLRLEDGWKADRALYNVVRQADLARADIQSVFGENGYVCSTAARSAIEAAGFQQLATSAHGGVCGAPTQSATSNFTLNQQVTTTTALSGTSTKGGAATLVAAVSGSSAPDGTVTFREGDVVLQSGVPLVSGQATYDLTGATPGSHSYRAEFVPASGSQFDPSTGAADVLVKAASSLSESFPASVQAGKRAQGTITVASAVAPTGKVTIFKGTKKLVSGSLVGSKLTVKLPALAKGKNTLRAVYAGSSTVAGSTKKFTITQK